MSMLLMVQAMQTKVGNPLRKLVLIKLADNANDKGECWPSFQHIADQCEISRRSVINHVNALIESGLLKKQTRKGPKGNSTNIYILSLDGAGDSLGGSAADSPPSAGDSLGGSAGAAPGISHSFEPVNEPSAKSIAKPKSKDDTEQAFETYWQAGMVKQNKKKALSLFTAYVKREKLCPNEFAEKLAVDVRARIAAEQMGFDRLHPTTYLANERWEDQVVTNTAQVASKPVFRGVVI